MLVESSQRVRLHEGNFIIYGPKDIRGIELLNFFVIGNSVKIE
jgi:hypothetical protein